MTRLFGKKEDTTCEVMRSSRYISSPKEDTKGAYLRVEVYIRKEGTKKDQRNAAGVEELNGIFSCVHQWKDEILKHQPIREVWLAHAASLTHLVEL